MCPALFYICYLIQSILAKTLKSNLPKMLFPVTLKLLNSTLPPSKLGFLSSKLWVFLPPLLHKCPVLCLKGPSSGYHPASFPAGGQSSSPKG